MNAFSNKLKYLRNKCPLVYCITNQVTINLVANSLLALGASPIMAHSEQEVGEITAAADALYLNIGTITPEKLNVMMLALQVAGKKNIPVVLDPVGAGASKLRQKACHEILASGLVRLIRGNASEILALAKMSDTSRGVDAVHSVAAARGGAEWLAGHYGLVVALTGETDLATNGRETRQISGGHALMTRITGMGCALSAILAAWLADEKDHLQGAVWGLNMVGQCGLRAGRRAQGPGTFVPCWLDELYLTN